MQGNAFHRWGWLVLWLLLTATVFFRAPIPIDETRYLSVAWEMWLRGDFLVPYLNGHTYSHKPPMLFWLIQAGWGLFGFNEWWPRLVGPLAALANLLLIRRVAEKLWPGRGRIALLAPWVLIATLLWTLFATSTMFDILLTACVLLGMLGLLEASAGKVFKGWGFVALAIGLGVLVKGPVILLHLIPTAVMVFFWGRIGGYRWFGWLLAAVLAGAAIALAWAIPAAGAGGEEYADAILWHQTADRTVGTKIHTRSWFWYLPFLPMFLFPWLFWPRVWAGLRNDALLSDRGFRFCLVWLVSTFVLFSLLPSKQVHYLIPMLPAFALILARVVPEDEAPRGLFAEFLPPILFGLVGVFLLLLPKVPGLSKLNWVQTVESDWGACVLAIAMALAVWVWRAKRLSAPALSTAVVSAVFVGLVFFFEYTGLGFDLRPAALRVKAFQEQGVAYAFVGNYQGQLNFLGHLSEPLPVLQLGEVGNWVGEHRNGFLISLEKNRPSEAVYSQPHREYWLVFRRAERFSELMPL